MDKLKKIKKALPEKKKSHLTRRSTKTVKPPKKLTLEQEFKREEFCKQYVLSRGNQTDAYNKVYNVKNNNVACVNAHHLLNDPNIRARIKEIKEQAEEATGLSVTYIVQELLDMADGHVDIVATKADYDNLSANQKKAVKRVEYTEWQDEQGNKHTGLKIEYYSKLECFKLIADLMKYTSKGSVQINVQNNNLFTETEQEFKKSMEI